MCAIIQVDEVGSMHLESNIELEDTVANIYKKITDIHNTSWRSDLKVVKGIDDNNFIEYSKKDYPTFYTVLKTVKNKNYELEFTNNKVEGHIAYTLKKEDTKTNLSIIVDLTLVDAKIKMIAKQKLKKQWSKFVEDLTRGING